MNTMLKTSLTVVAIASLANASFADSTHPWETNTRAFPDRMNASRSNSVPRQVVSRRAYSYEPSPVFKAGDTVVVAKATSELKIGDRVITKLPKGTRFTVVAVQGGWIGANVEQNGQKLSGWLLYCDLATDAAAAPSPAR